jgi:hypothetical protein
MDTHELAYYAGFFEGEGNAGYYSCGVNGHVLTVELHQNNPMPLIEAKRVFGYGHVLIRTTRCSRWRVTGKRAKDFLRRIYPYCKYRQALVERLMT